MTLTTQREKGGGGGVGIGFLGVEKGKGRSPRSKRYQALKPCLQRDSEEMFQSLPSLLMNKTEVWSMMAQPTNVPMPDPV